MMTELIKLKANKVKELSSVSSAYSVMQAAVFLKQLQATENWVKSPLPDNVSPMMPQQAQTHY